MTHDRPLLGISLMLLFCILAPVGDAVTKLLSGNIPLVELLTVRFAVQVLILAPVVMLSQRSFRMPGRVLALLFLRTILHMTAMGAMFTALFYLPLADAVAIAFVMPFLMLLLGKYILHEEVGFRRLIACGVGFAGTLLVIQPSFAEVGLPALLPLAVAVLFSLFMLITRQIAKQVDPISLQTVSGGMAMLIILPLLAMSSDFETGNLTLLRPGLEIGSLLMVIGLLGTLAHLVMTWALRYAPSTTLAPMQYLEIPIATLIGWAVFGDLPNTMASVGIAIIMCAGLYIVIRERAMLRASQAAPAQPEIMTSVAE